MRQPAQGEHSDPLFVKELRHVALPGSFLLLLCSGAPFHDVARKHE
jgi:hypothetical protein